MIFILRAHARYHISSPFEQICRPPKVGSFVPRHPDYKSQLCHLEHETAFHPTNSTPESSHLVRH